MKRRNLLKSFASLPFVGLLGSVFVSNTTKGSGVSKKMITDAIDRKILELKNYNTEDDKYRRKGKKGHICFSKKAWIVMYGNPEPVTIKGYIRNSPLYNIPMSEYRGFRTTMDLSCNKALTGYMISVLPYKLKNLKEAKRWQREWKSVIELK